MDPDILDYLDGPSVISGILKSRKEESQRERKKDLKTKGGWATGAKASALNKEQAAWTKEGGQPLGAGKGKEEGSRPEPQEEHSPAATLILSHIRLLTHKTIR